MRAKPSADKASAGKTPFLPMLYLLTMFLQTLFLPTVFAVEVEPLRVELAGKAGQTVTGTVKVVNHRDAPVIVQAQPGEYRYTFTAHTQQPADPAAQRLPSCRAWVTITPEELQLAPDTAGELMIRVAVPEAAASEGAGEHVAAILVDERPATEPSRGGDGNTVTIVPRVAIPLYLLGDGEAPAGRLTTFQATAGPQAGVVQLLLTVANEGRVHLRPTGTVLVTNARHEVVHRGSLGRTIPIFPQFAEAIPVWVSLAPDRYTAVATVDLGGGELSQQETTFTVTADGRVREDVGR